MNCVHCDHLMEKRELPAYVYRSSGLSNLTLHDITTYHCPSCDDEMICFQSIGPLHRAVAHVLATKSTRLAPFEVRFLRDHLGWGNQEFARRMGVTQFHASRWTTTQQISGAAERLLRLFALVGTKETSSKEAVKKDRVLCDAIAAFAATPRSGISKLDARLCGKTWRVEIR